MFRRKKESIEGQTLRYLKKHEFDLAKYLIEASTPRYWTPITLAIYFSFIWLMIAMLAIAVGLNAF